MQKKLIGIAAAFVAVVTVGAVALRESAPVGHFTSGPAQDRYVRAYDRAMADMPPPDRTLDLRTGYGIVRVYHFRGGGGEQSKEPLLLLPGTASGTPVWADNMPSLLRVRDVYTVDLLGEPGLSVQTRPIEGPADHAAWLDEVIRQLPAERVHLMGLSIGGWTAANLAVRHPAKVAGLILVEPIRVFGDLAPQAVARSLPASVRWLPKAWRDDFASWTANDAPVEDVPEAVMIEAGMQTYAMANAGPQRPDDDALRALGMPVLVLLARDSRMHDAPAAAEHARELLPGATVRVYPDASHAINGEYPDRIAADVGAFVS